MRVPFYNIQAQYQDLQVELDAVVHEVISSGNYVLGPYNKKLEAQFCELHKVKHAIAVHSGTDALRIMMDAVGIGPGDEVITTAFTFVASTETIVQTGATPVFVDIDPITYNIDVSKIEAAITPKTKAILPVHLFGQLGDVAGLMEIACANNLVILEDSAQAVCCEYNGTPTGNFGVAAGLSFYVTKNLGAAGDGGLILTNSDEIAEKCRSIRVHGMGRERYYYDHLGYTARLDEMQAAVLSVKLSKIHEWNAARGSLAAIYDEKLAGLPLGLPVTSLGNNNIWHQYSIRTERRDELQAYLKEREVDSMIYYPVPLHFHSPYSRFGHGPGSLPETERAAKEILNLPIQPHLSQDQVAFAADQIRTFNLS